MSKFQQKSIAISEVLITVQMRSDVLLVDTKAIFKFPKKCNNLKIE